MNRKLAKKLTNTVNHQREVEEEEAAAAAYSLSSRRPPITEDDEAEDELSRPVGRHQRPFDIPANPFSYYDRQSQSRTDLGSAERSPAPVPAPSPRLGASILRMPSPLPQKSTTSDRYSDRDEDFDEDGVEPEEDDDEEDNDQYESSTSLRMSRTQGRNRDPKLTRKDKQVNIKKGSGGTSNSTGRDRDRAQSEDKKVTRKTSKSKEVNQGQGNSDAKRSSRDRGGSGASLSGNGNYLASGSNARVNRSGSVGNSRGGGGAGNSSNQQLTRHDLPTLPIEIPECVTDVDAFRRYLSNSDSIVESVGGGYGPPYGSTKTKHLNSPEGLAGAAAASLLVQRKSMALSHAIMTLALLSASASQLRFVVAYSNAHSYPALNYFLICSCIFVEIMVGIGYVIVSRFEFSERTLDKTNSFLIFGLFFVAIANVIIASFALDDHVCEVMAVLAKQKDREQFDTLDNSSPVVSAHQQIT